MTDQVFFDEGSSICPSNNEMWDVVTRRVLAKLSKFKDFAAKKTYQSKKSPPKKTSEGTSATVAVEKAAQRSREEKEMYDLYVGFVKRDKELYQLLVDIYQMKCIVLKCLGETHDLPPAPKYRPFPQLNSQLLQCRRQSQRHSEAWTPVSPIMEENIENCDRNEEKKGRSVSFNTPIE